MPKLTKKYLEDTKEYSMNLLRDINTLITKYGLINSENVSLSSKWMVLHLKNGATGFEDEKFLSFRQSYHDLTQTLLATRLARFGIRTKYIKDGGGKCYVLKDFKKAFDKYLPKNNTTAKFEFDVEKAISRLGHTVAKVSKPSLKEPPSKCIAKKDSNNTNIQIAKELKSAIEKDMEITMKCKDAINDVLESIQSLGKEMKFVKDVMCSIGGIIAITIITVILINLFSK